MKTIRSVLGAGLFLLALIATAADSPPKEGAWAPGTLGRQQ